MENIMNELIENRIAELNASRVAIENDPERQAETKTESWQNDSHKKTFGRYSSEWDWHHTACRLDKRQKIAGHNLDLMSIKKG